MGFKDQMLELKKYVVRFQGHKPSVRNLAQVRREVCEFIQTNFVYTTSGEAIEKFWIDIGPTMNPDPERELIVFKITANMADGATPDGARFEISSDDAFAKWDSREPEPTTIIGYGDDDPVEAYDRAMGVI